MTQPSSWSIRLERIGESVEVEVRSNGNILATGKVDRLPAVVLRRKAQFISRPRRSRWEEQLAELGDGLRLLCLPGSAAIALADLLDRGEPADDLAVSFESADSELLGLPFEALRLADGRVLALLPRVSVARRLLGAPGSAAAPLPAGPLKILVAIGAPDEGKTSSSMLDQERELQNILDAVDLAQGDQLADVRILEVGSPAQIGLALENDAFHVAHLSCHGGPGFLELETEDGEALRVSAEHLLAPLAPPGGRLPMVFLNACHGGVSGHQVASLAEAMLRSGAPGVIAMLTSVSDRYASQLAGRFYRHLAGSDPPVASQALAAARQELEAMRLQALRTGSAASEDLRSEFATATFFVAAAESPLFDPAREAQPLRARPAVPANGPIPNLRMDDLIGRRKVLREVLRIVRDPAKQVAGVILTGIGGIGKSAVAGRVLQRCEDQGWRVVAHRGRLDLGGIAEAVGMALARDRGEPAAEPAGLLGRSPVDELERFAAVGRALSRYQLLLVLDDFEENLEAGGSDFKSAELSRVLGSLLGSVSRGAVLITSRHPLPTFATKLHEIPLGPLSNAECRKLLLRLDSLRGESPENLQRTLRRIGGHPRLLELLDALRRDGQGRLPHVTRKLAKLLATGNGRSAAPPPQDLTAATGEAVLLGSRDILLAELLALAELAGTSAVLLQLAVSNLPVLPATLSRMLSDDPSAAEAFEDAAVTRALDQLARLSLVHRDASSSAWVHRWTAEALAGLTPEPALAERCRRAGETRWQRARDGGFRREEAVEALRNFLAAREFDRVPEVAMACFAELDRAGRSAEVAALAAETLESFPAEHDACHVIADAEARACLKLGWSERAKVRWRASQSSLRQRFGPHGVSVDVLCELATSYCQIGDALLSEGNLGEAKSEYSMALGLRTFLAETYPEDSRFQRYLASSHDREGHLSMRTGQLPEAGEAYRKSFEIAAELAAKEPDRADLRKELAISCEQMAGICIATGQLEAALSFSQEALEHRQAATATEAQGADEKQGLLPAYDRLGVLSRQLGRDREAYAYFQKMREIAEASARTDPDRVDFQDDLSTCYQRLGDLFADLGQEESARNYHEKCIEIDQSLVDREIEQTKHLSGLAQSHQRLGDHQRRFGHWDAAKASYQTALVIVQLLAEDGLDLDHQISLAIAHEKLALVEAELGNSASARTAYGEAIELWNRWIALDPNRVELLSQLAGTLNNLSNLEESLGQNEAATLAAKRSVDLLENLLGNQPEQIELEAKLAGSLMRLGRQLRISGPGPEGRAALTKALEILRGLVGLEPKRVDYREDLAICLEYLGDVQLFLGENELARKSFEEALSIRRSLAASTPDRADLQHALAISLDRRGDDFLAAGKPEDALGAYREALGIRQAVAALDETSLENRRRLGASYFKLAEVFQNYENPGRAREPIEQARDIFESLSLLDAGRLDIQRELAVCHEKAGDLYLSLGEGARSHAAYSRACEIRERVLARNPKSTTSHRDLAISCLKLADWSRAHGAWQRADELYRRALAMAEELAQAEPRSPEFLRDCAVCRERLGDVFVALNRPEDARASYSDALATWRRLVESVSDLIDFRWGLAVTWLKMCDAYRLLDRMVDALAACREALSLAGPIVAEAPGHLAYRQGLASILEREGDLCLAMQDGDSSELSYRRSLEIREDLSAAEPARADLQRELAVAFSKISELCLAVGRPEEALAACLKDCEITERLAQAEPDRADRQVDLAISLANFSQFAGSDRRALIEEAIAILRRLADRGALAPVDLQKIEVFREMLEDAPP